MYDIISKHMCYLHVIKPDWYFNNITHIQRCLVNISFMLENPMCANVVCKIYVFD